MHTLNRWKHLLDAPQTIDCPYMQIVGHRVGEQIFEGSGQIHIRSNMRADFVMHATPLDEGEAFRRLRHAAQNSYDARWQLGVRGTEYDGTEWNLGWVPLRLGETLGNKWELSGPIQSLNTGTDDPFIATKSGFEVIYDTKLHIPLPLNMSTQIELAGTEVLRKFEPGGKSVDVLGTQINFFIDPELDATWAIAETAEEFPHPYAENWVSEPLCLLLGQLVFPRLIARNFGNRSTISLRLSPTVNHNTLAASILQEDPIVASDHFWEAYRQILTMIAHARNANGRPNFEAHPLTHYYYEIIQATQGSNWVWCMTLASAIEGIAKLLTPEEERKSDFTAETLEDLQKHVNKWQGDAALRKRIIGSIKFAELIGSRQMLKRFCKNGVVSKHHMAAWETVRNQVMHGELVPPWSDETLEGQMRLLADLMHRLSMKYVHEHAQ